MSKITDLFNKTRIRAIEIFGRSFYHDLIMLTMLGLYAGLSVITLLTIIFRVTSANVTIPLVYNVVYGVTSIGPWYYIYYYFLAGVLLGAMNILIAWAFFEKERLISYLLGFVNIIIAVLFLLFMYNLTALLG